MKILQLISTHNCLQFGTTTVILDKRIKYQESVKGERDFEMSMQSG